MTDGKANHQRGRIARPSRRTVLAGLAGAGVAAGLPVGTGRAARAPMMRAFPSTGFTVPAVGMGTWITFNVGADERLRADRAKVLQRFFDEGGGLVDSSPMYGSSEDVIGWCLKRTSGTDGLVSATKVWTPMQSNGVDQMDESRALWGLERFDLMQVHNLQNWDGHLETLKRHKDEGRVRHIGVTTSHGRRHAELEEVMRGQPLDAVQITYNILDREAEDRLLPLAAERGMAVIVNRPYRRKQLVRMAEGKPLPGWAGEIEATNWPQALLKFILSHPAVTCAIPATTRVDHMAENMGAMRGPLPDEALRRRMIRDFEAL